MNFARRRQIRNHGNYWSFVGGNRVSGCYDPPVELSLDAHLIFHQIFVISFVKMVNLNVVNDYEMWQLMNDDRWRRRKFDRYDPRKLLFYTYYLDQPIGSNKDGTKNDT